MNPFRNCSNCFLIASSWSAPRSSKTVWARETSRRPPKYGLVPSVRKTGSQAFWLRIVPKASLTRAHHGDRLAAEDAFDIRCRPRKPVDGVLQNTRHRVVVFGCRQKQTAAFRDRLLHFSNSSWYAFRRFHVAVVKRYAFDTLNLEFCASRHQFHRCPQQSRVERAAS